MDPSALWGRVRTFEILITAQFLINSPPFMEIRTFHYRVYKTSVGTAIDYGSDGRSSISCRDKKLFFMPQRLDRRRGPTSLLFN
jgi:hypothetical protein